MKPSEPATELLVERRHSPRGLEKLESEKRRFVNLRLSGGCACWLVILMSVFGSTVFATGGDNITRLTNGWEYYRGGLGSIWEIWRGDKATDNVEWLPVTLPHCFNARDAVDPDRGVGASRA